MLITAKFASTCPACSQRIAIGSQVEWSRGTPARHVSCTGAPVQAASRSYARSAPRGRRTGCSCGSVEGQYRDGDCWQCRHDA